MTRRLDVPQSLSGRFGDVVNIVPMPEIEPHFLCRTAHNLGLFPDYFIPVFYVGNLNVLLVSFGYLE